MPVLPQVMQASRSETLRSSAHGGLRCLTFMARRSCWKPSARLAASGCTLRPLRYFTVSTLFRIWELKVMGQLKGLRIHDA